MTDAQAPDVNEGAVADDAEQPPLGGVPFSKLYSDPVPFGSPPAEDVTVVGEIPWELRDDE